MHHFEGRALSSGFQLTKVGLATVAAELFLAEATRFPQQPHGLTKCSGLMKPDTHLGENARQIEVPDDQTTPFLFR
ncbi:hypothetical protein SAMN04490209_3905 [Pseudomonas rhodesiae]|uniref:Uncharacterized protein n=1 Tax=Pseudomonas rhodesiae TaxID=76760 RepID=A0AAE8HF37_9PSED|nr:hypothetical protein SAMN04490209_3905 [Pseudomonas rhodesiae]